ncbi:unnamed protein product [Lymnaea stagnalis]|uniref:Mucin-4-like C8-3 domain-containing protein n=1 Tax=Lymnaea stagnalis TaxID=6523 RepID=A0AAV2HL66_LYMST
MSERELLYSFGRHWEVSAHNTIFAYGKGENSSTFSHPDFVPLFGDEVSPETARVAEQTCGKNNTECIIDYVVTGSQEFASSTMQSFLKQQSFVSNLANNPPELSLKNDSLNSLGQWNVTESKDSTLEVFPEDADGDVVSIELVGNHTGAIVRNRSIIYTPDAKNPINLG